MTNDVGLAFLLSLVILGSNVRAADPIPSADAKLMTDGQIWQGQRVNVNLTIKTPDMFASAPALDLPRVPGTILVPPSGRPTLGTETIDDTSFTTQTHLLSVYSQHAGATTIPPFEIRFESSTGFGKSVIARIVTTPAVSFTVKQPPGTEHLQMVSTTTKLTLTETWQPEPSKDSVAVGSAFTRIIQIQAENLPGIVLPSFRMALPEGLQVYHQTPILADEDNRGDLVGKRTETTTIVCQRPGHYEIPAMRMEWWNPREQKLHESTLPARSITVTAESTTNHSDQAESLLSSADHSRLRWLIPITGLLFILLGGYFIRRSIVSRWHAYRHARAMTEPQCFTNLVKACQSGDRQKTYSAIMRWRDKIESISAPQVSTMIPTFNCDPQLLTEFDLLESTLYGPTKTVDSINWSPERLLNRLVRFRSHWKRELARSATNAVLPELNSTVG